MGGHPAEQRAAKLAQATAALRDTIESLRTPDDLEALLGHTLKSIADQIGATSASVWLFDPDLVAHLLWTIEDGRIVRGAESRHANAHKPSKPNAWHYEWLRGMGTPAPNVHAVADHPGMTPEQRAFLLARGVKALISVPVVLEKQLVGSFTLHVRQESYPLAEDLELIQALANHAALAFRLTRLAEARAAHLRAESLARFAQSSRQTLDQLASSAHPDAFLGDVLRVSSQQLGAQDGSVWTELADGNARMDLTSELGEPRPPPEPIVVPFPQRARSGEIYSQSTVDLTSDPVYGRFREQFIREGIRRVTFIPLVLRGEFRGAVVLRFREDGHLTPDEIELARTFASQAILAMELSRLSRAARATAVSDERNRLARDIHDTIAQSLAAIIRQLEGASVAATPDLVAQRVAVAIAIARESLVDARRSIRALRPSALEGRTLEEALRDLVGRSAHVTSSELRFSSRGKRALDSDVEDELFRITQEALVNAIKHARAKRIDVVLDMDEGVRVSVRDDGCGYDPGSTRCGVGSNSMRERAARIHASITIASEPGAGTEVLVFWATRA